MSDPFSIIQRAMASLTGVGGPQGYAALGNPGKRAVFPIAQRGPVQGRVARHESLDATDVVVVDRPLELTDLFEGIDVRLELRPTREAIELRDLELRIGEGRSTAGLRRSLA